MLATLKQYLPTSFKNQLKKWLRINIKNPAPKETYTHYNGKKILDIQEANHLITQQLTSEIPLLITRLGSIEQACLYRYIEIQQKTQKGWTIDISNAMQNNAGFFPPTAENLEKFAQLLITCLAEVDILGVWFNRGEKYTCEHLCPQAQYTILEGLEPYYNSQNPWSKHLKDKKVLVIHPFEQSIKNQYQKRHLLFSNTDILPDFELLTIKAVQSIANTQTPYKDWFEALDHMNEQIAAVQFDVALIGAGAYGMPLAYQIKKLGKQAIHLGGATQILFGIKGKRWEQFPFFQQLFNPYWETPLAEETPALAKNVENGCYW